MNGVNYEIAKFRTESNYSDNRRPDEVIFTSSLEEDVNRRDFTINGIAYSLKEGLIDYVNGIDDIKTKTLRCIGSTQGRLEEDNLRILRAIRFKTQYNLKFDAELSHIIYKNPKLISSLPIERIREEFNKILLSDNVENGLYMLSQYNLLNIIIPELSVCVNYEQNNKHHDKDLFGHIVDVVKNTKPNLITRLSALLHDIGKVKCQTTDEKGQSHYYSHHKISADMSVEILNRMKYDNKTIEAVRKVIYVHGALH